MWRWHSADRTSLPLLIYIALLFFLLIYIALLSSSSLLLYLHCAVIFLFSPSLLTLRCYLPLLFFFVALLSLSLQCDSKKEASDTGNIQQEEEDDAHTRNEDDAQVSRLENNMYDVWTEAVLMYSTVQKLCLLYSTVDCTEVEYSTVDWAVHLPQKSYRSYAYCSLYLRLFVFCVFYCTVVS